jgi:hypothetical protein
VLSRMGVCVVPLCKLNSSVLQELSLPVAVLKVFFTTTVDGVGHVHRVQKRVYERLRTHIHSHTHTQTNTHTYTRAHTHTHTHSRTHTHTHTHTQTHFIPPTIYSLFRPLPSFLTPDSKPPTSLRSHRLSLLPYIYPALPPSPYNLSILYSNPLVSGA